MASEIEAWQRKALLPTLLPQITLLVDQAGPQMPKMVNANCKLHGGKQVKAEGLLSGDRLSKITYKRACKWDSWASTQLQ